MTDFDDDYVNDPQAIIDFESENMHLAAVDELDAMEECETGEDMERYHNAFERRREKLNELDRERIKKMAYDPESIQEVFDRLGIPIEL